MKSNLVVDTSDFDKAMQAIQLTAFDTAAIGQTGAKVLINGMRMRVPVDTADTKKSISSHVAVSTALEYSDEVGAETPYAPYIEYGIETVPAYPKQPFVRPTAWDDFDKVIRVISVAFAYILEKQWKK